MVTLYPLTGLERLWRGLLLSLELVYWPCLMVFWLQDFQRKFLRKQKKKGLAQPAGVLKGNLFNWSIDGSAEQQDYD